MNPSKHLPKILHPIAVLSVAFIICFSLPSQHACSEEAQSATAQQVDEILKKVDIEKGEEPLEACKKLYSMGPEIDPLLLQELREIDITKVNRPDRTPVTIASILASRGYDKDVFEILKSRLRSENPEDRLSAAIMVSLCYEYNAVHDLAGIVSGEKDPAYLSEKAMYQWKATSQEVVEQILDVMRGKSNMSKRFAVLFLGVHGLKCPECQYDAAKWRSSLEENKYVEYLGSDWLENRKLTGGEVEGITDLTSSSDGTKIAFVWRYISAERFNTDIWIMDTLANKVIKVRVPGTNSGLSWSPDGARILFINMPAKGFNISTIKKDGTEFCIWTKSFLSSNDNKAEWAHDSSKIAYVKKWFMPEAANEIWVTDLNKSGNMRIVKDNLCFCQSIKYKVYPIWLFSKNDKILLWDCYGEDKASVGIYSVSLNVPEKEELVQAFDLDLGADSLFASPDETKLGFTKGDGHLFIYDFATKKTKEYSIAECNYLSGFCLWTPDGKGIVFSKYNSEKQSEIHILSLKTGKSTKLANGSLWGEAFGPGGKSVHYLQYDPQTKRNSIWRVNLDGTNNTKIFPAEGIEYTTVQPAPILKWAEGNAQ